MRPSCFPAFLLGLIIGLAIIPIGVYCYFRFGMAPVATNSQPMPFEKSFAKMGLQSRMKNEYPHNAPISGDEANYMAGAHLYREHCAVCHGATGQPATSVAKGMYPKPPQLVDGKHGVTDDPAGETYWKVANGIRMTGMPSFKQSLSDTQMWQVSLMLANDDKLPADVNSVLSQPLPKDQPAAGSAGGK